MAADVRDALAVIATSDDQVDPVGGDLGDGGRGVLVAVVDHVARTRGGHAVGLGGSGDGGDDCGGGPSRELDRGATTASAPPATVTNLPSRAPG
jgi:hypothetical protein